MLLNGFFGIQESVYKCTIEGADKDDIEDILNSLGLTNENELWSEL